VLASVGFYARFYRALYRNLSRDAKRLVLAGGLNSLPFGVNSVALPIYLTRLGYDGIVVGSVFSIQGAVAVLLTIPLGIAADRFGRKRMVILGGVLSALSFFLYPFMTSLAVAYVAAVLAGLAGAFAFAPLQALLTDATKEEVRTVVFGMSFFVQSATTSIGSLASAVPDLLLGWGIVPAYTPLFVGAGLAMLAAPVLLARTAIPEIRRAARRGILPVRSARMISKYFTSNIIIGLGAGLIIPIFSLWFLLKYGVAESFTGPLFALSNVVNAVAFLVAPILAHSRGLVRTVVTLQGLSTLFLLGLAVIPATGAFLWVASVLFLARNASMNMSSPVSSSFLMGAVEPDERSSASAVVGVSFRLPFAVSTTFGAAMMQANTDAPLFVTSGLYAIGVSAFYVFFRNVPEKRAGPVPPKAQVE